MNVLYKLIQGNRATFTVSIEKSLCNNFGIVHGGAVHLIYLDLAKHHISLSENLPDLQASSVNIHFLTSMKSSTTINLNTNYIKSNESGLLIGRGEIILDGSTLALCSALFEIND